MRILRQLSFVMVHLLVCCVTATAQRYDPEALQLLGDVPEYTYNKELQTADSLNQLLFELSRKKSLLPEYIHALCYEIEIRRSLGNHEEAVANIKLLEKLITDETKPVAKSQKVMAYSFIGDYYWSSFDYEASVDYYGRGKDIYEKYGDEVSANDASYLLSNLSDAYLHLGRYKEALLLTEKVLDIDLKQGGTNEYIGVDYCNLGLIQLHTDLEAAIVSLNKSKWYFGKTNVDNYQSYLIAYLTLAEVYLKQGRLEWAMAETDTILQRADFSNRLNYEILGQAFEKRGDILRANYQSAAALENFDESLRFFNRLYGESRNCYDCQRILLKKADGYLDDCHFEKAGEYISQVFSSIDASGFPGQERIDKVLSPQFLFDVYQLDGQNKFHLFTTGNEPDTSLLRASAFAYRQAMEVFSRINKDLPEAMSREIFFNQHYETFYQAVEVNYLLWTLNQEKSVEEDLLLLFELSKNAEMNAAINSDILNNEDIVIDSLLGQLAAVNERINIVEKQYFHAQKTNDQLLKAQARELVVNYRLEKERLMDDFKNRFPFAYKMRFRPNRIEVASIQRQLTHEEGVLMYYQTDFYLYGMVIDREEVYIRRVQNPNTLKATVDSLNQNMALLASADKTERDRAFATYKRVAFDLYRQVFAPFEELLPPVLIIIPHGQLGRLSFDALLTANASELEDFKSLPYLINNYSITYGYSAKSMFKNQKRDSRQLGNMLAMAPDFKARPGFSLSSFLGMGYLAHNEKEAYRVRRITGGKVYAGGDATEDNFVVAAPDYKILHLATHGVVDKKDEEFSYLTFNEVPDSIENEWLYIKDVHNLKLHAELVVLSACESGNGRWRKGEGIVSVAKAFRHAGADAVLSSFWTVSDKNTLDLMERFYENIKNGNNKNNALTNAKKAYLAAASPENANPYYWAGFTLVGKRHPIKLGVPGFLNGYGWWILIGVLVLLGGALWLRRRRIS